MHWDDNSHPENSKNLLKNIFISDADLKVNNKNKILEVYIHNFNNKNSGKVVKHLCDVLNEMGTIFPYTDLRIFYKLISN